MEKKIINFPILCIETLPIMSMIDFYICTCLLRFNNRHDYVRNFTIGKISTIELAIIESTLMSYLHPHNKKNQI